MARNPLISEARLKLIEQRQSNPGWGPHYQPSMRATRDEAPTISRPSTLYAKKLGRDLHLMSLPERQACLLALYHPRCFDIREQHMLAPFPAPHPLAGRSDTKHEVLMPFKGTVDVAERLGMLHRHPVVWLSESSAIDGTQIRNRAAFPYLGDLLLFLLDEKGPYCVNWTVKKDNESFAKQGGRAFFNPSKAHRIKESAELRHRLEEMYFSDAGIRTQRVGASEIAPHVSANLTALVGRAAAPIAITKDAEHAMTQQFRALIGTHTPPLSLLGSMTAYFNCTRADCLSVLYRGIWSRNLRVDLYRPVLPDKPLRSEQSDVMLDYVTWFRR